MGGTFGAVMIQNTWARFYDGMKQLRLAFVRARQVDRESLSVLLEWGDQAKLNGMLAFESIDPAGIHPFAKRGLELIANGVATAVIEDALQRELDAYERNHMAAARIWQQAGGYAPTFGIHGGCARPDSGHRSYARTGATQARYCRLLLWQRCTVSHWRTWCFCRCTERSGRRWIANCVSGVCISMACLRYRARSRPTRSKRGSRATSGKDRLSCSANRSRSRPRSVD